MAIVYKSRTFFTSDLAVKNLRTSLDVQKQSFLFSPWLPHDKGLPTFDIRLPAKQSWFLVTEYPAWI